MDVSLDRWRKAVPNSGLDLFGVSFIDLSLFEDNLPSY